MSRMNTDHTGDAAEHDEPAAHDELEGTDFPAADDEGEHEGDGEDEREDEGDDEALDEVAHFEVDEAYGERDESRHRRPASAAALAKRVAMDRSARIAVGSLVLVAMMFLFVFPTRSYLAQRGQVNDARHSLQVLRTQNEKLAREAQRLQTDREIEQLARSQFNMVFDGEEAYNVVPPRGTAAPTTVP
jgi:cell division protein FtsB